LTECLRCNRQARIWVSDPGKPADWFCSKLCVERGKMVDPTAAEVAGMVEGASRGGEYLDSIGKTNLAALSPDEWMTFIESVCTGFVERVQAEPPF
jgi:hypothetical protein